MTTVTVSKKALDALIKLARYHDAELKHRDSHANLLRRALINLGHDPYEDADNFKGEVISEAIKAADHIEY